MAGLGAACAAGRAGARVLLVERLEMLGGLGSAGMVGNFSYGHHRVKAQGRVFDEVIEGLRSLNAIGEDNGYRCHVGTSAKAKVYRQDGSGEFDIREDEPIFFNMTFNAAMLPLVLQHVALGCGVDVLYATDVVGATVKGGAVTEVVLHNRSLLQRVVARVFIDAAGDGILSRHAGAEELPRDDAGHPAFIQPSNMVFLHRTPGGTPAGPMELLEELDEPEIRWSLWPEPDRVGIKMGMFHKSYDNADGRSHSDAVIDFRRNVPRFVREFQTRFADRFGADLTFEMAAPMLGMRESSRIRGDYVLTADDVVHGRRFDDGVAYAMSVLDSQFTEKEKVPPFQIPYRSLLVGGLSNLFVVGRCFSGDRLALSSTRVMPTGCLMGQAAGYGAALAVETGRTIREVDPAAIRARLVCDASDADYLAMRLAPPAEQMQEHTDL